jgi:hypothetical protein
MKPSQFRKDGDDFLAVWETAGIGIGFSRIRETDSGMLYAELDVQSIRPDVSGTLLSPSRFNLMAATERKRLAEILVQRAPDVIWADALESAIGRVITEFRTPEPLVDLWDVADPGENAYLIHPLLVENDTNLWYADEQSLKSYLAMVCAASIVSGRVVPAIGAPSRTGPVLLYDWETFDGKQRRRLTRVANGLGAGALRQIHYRRMTRPLIDSIGMIRAEASRLGAVLVVFDSLGWLCNGDINKPEIALPAMNAIGSIQGTTRLVLAHHGKSGRLDSEATSVFGSAFFEFGSRNRWLIRKSQDEGAETVRIGLYHKKASDDRRFTSMGLAFKFDQVRDAVTVSAARVDEDPELLKNASQPTRIRAMLRETEFCKATVEDIAKATGIPATSVKTQLGRMNGVVNLGGHGGRGNKGLWALSVDGRPETVNSNTLKRSKNVSVSAARTETENGNSNRENGTVLRFRGSDDEDLPF